MSYNVIQTSFASGELSPSLFGRTDLAKFKSGCSTMRNFFVNYRGGATSRAGTAFVGMCKQGAPWLPGNSGITLNPPRDIPFQFNINQGYDLEFGDQYMRIVYRGAYVTESAKTITSVSIAGLFTVASHGYSVGDWVYDLGNVGFNGLTWVVATVPTGNTFTVTDLFGNVISSATASTGGTVARIYTVVSPYAAIDLQYLKYTQSADTMTLDCVNSATETEYPPYELTRLGQTDWTFTEVSFASAISPPATVTGSVTSSTTKDTYYSYVVTAVNTDTNEESVASKAVSLFNNDISINAGSNIITWSAVTGANMYNIYKSTPAYDTPVAIGANYGYAGSAFGTQFTDTNITADFTTTPPQHNNPFARGAIDAVNITAGGTSYTQATVGYTITTSTGSGFSGSPVVVSGAVVAFIIEDSGQNYAGTDTITITDSGSGSGATATLTIGAQTGTYPSVPAYYQQRRVYANTLDAPDTYFMSQPGLYNNMDASIPTTDSDAIVGTPWAQQINGIQFMVPMMGNLLIFTGLGAWSVTGGNNAAITPADETATAQAYNGCNATVPPIVINYDVLYVQSKGSIVRDLAYNFWVNIFTGTDKTVLSSHLFNFHQILHWAYAEEPYKIVWAVRDDGTMLSLTYLKEEDIYGWARHDTNGQFIDTCSIIEPPVDAVYFTTYRYIQGEQKWAYYKERMDNRNWENSEDVFAVDAGLSYPMTYPNAVLMPSAANGTNNISAVNLIDGGAGYVSPVVVVNDPSGVGSGATFSVTVSGGVITAITVLTQGANYAFGSTITITDTSGGNGAAAAPIITNNVVFKTSASVFNSGMVGNVIRIGNNNASSANNFTITPNGGGQATITSYVSGTEVVANITQPITNVIPNDPFNTPAPVSPDQWSISVPTTVVSDLNHLEGMQVAILADGGAVPNQVVTDGQITLPIAASAITVGLPYTGQLQTMYLDPPDQTTSQGKRKSVNAVTVRMENSRGVFAGVNQPDQSTQPNNATVAWSQLAELKERGANNYMGQPIDLITGDAWTLLFGEWDSKGQIAIQVQSPMCASISAVVPEFTSGDTAG